MSTGLFEEELEYLYDYAKKTLLYFIPLWDSAEMIAGKGAPASRVRQIALDLISELIDRGVQTGEISQHEDRDIDTWDDSKEAILSRIEEGMKQAENELDLVDICGFKA